MISMTTYWQQYKNYIDNLPEALPENEEYSRQIATAKTMINIGLTIENLGVTEIKQVVNRLHTTAKEFNHEVVYQAPDKEYKFSLPQITNSQSLIFAILYYQHLSNYANVSYQGSISFLFKGMVTSAVNEKKKPTAHQANAMLGEIKKYCESHNIALDETLLLNTNKEKAEDYVSKLVSTYMPLQSEPSPDEPVAPLESPSPIQDIESTTEEQVNLTAILSPPEERKNTSEEVENLTLTELPLKKLDNTAEDIDELTILRLSLDDLNQQKAQLQLKIDAFSFKKNQLDEAREQHVKLKNEWKNTWFISKVFYWLFSWAFEFPLLKNIKIAEQKLSEQEDSLNHEIPSGKTADSYLGELSIELTQLNSSIGSIGEKIDHQIEIEQLKLEALKQEQLKQEQLRQEELARQNAVKQQELLKELLINDSSNSDLFDEHELQTFESEQDEFSDEDRPSQKVTASKPEVESDTQSLKISSNHGFFKQYMPSRMTLQAIAVAGAAIAIQNLL
ncbi:hypothetical protein ELY21_04205 [Legionella sp. km535]|uniref:hypothetical protein n=1 Tax=Legionella sp. km535 TaxID=2498107 RepID=UPI000F8CC967|nr:hypothetical protein [Legionella sp. km535]RUR19429.1 hypothetical protein ELY21_04205 [Legionella sp. km535]